MTITSHIPLQSTSIFPHELQDEEWHVGIWVPLFASLSCWRERSRDAALLVWLRFSQNHVPCREVPPLFVALWIFVGVCLYVLWAAPRAWIVPVAGWLLARVAVPCAQRVWFGFQRIKEFRLCSLAHITWNIILETEKRMHLERIGRRESDLGDNNWTFQVLCVKLHFNSYIPCFSYFFLFVYLKFFRLNQCRLS